MTSVEAFGWLFVLALAVIALGSASVRVASRLSLRPELRIIAAATIGSAAAVGMAVLLGLVTLGENAWALLGGSLLVWLVVRARVAAPSGPGLGTQLVAAARATRPVDAAIIGGATGALSIWLADLLWRPSMPFDALLYHLTWPVVWLHNGRPGSLVHASQLLPVQGYPKNTEVLVGWFVGLSHTYLAGTIVMFGDVALAALAIVSALRMIGIGRRHGALLAAAVLLCPVVVIELSGPSTDITALSWIVVPAALALGSRDEPGLLPVLLVAGGFAIGTKATTAPAVLVILALALASHYRGGRRLVRPVSIAAVPALALALTWYVQDWAVYGAPLYPFYRFPSGSVPITISAYNTSFLKSARSSLRVGTAHGYFHWIGGGAVLLAGVVVAVLLVPVVRRGERRLVLWSVLAALAAIAIWSSGPFTGYPGLPGTAYFPLDGMRYLLPSLPIIALPLAALIRSGGWPARVGAALLAVAFAADAAALRYWPPPYRASVQLIVGGLVVGLAVGAFVGVLTSGRANAGTGAGRTGRLRWRLAPAGRIVLTVACCALGAAVLDVPQHDYLAHAASGSQPGQSFEVPQVLGWLDRQQSWVHGRQTVATGPEMDAYLAGPSINHELVLVTEQTSCARIEALHRSGWLVLENPAVYKGFFSFDTFTRSRCLGPVQPAYSTGGFSVFPPVGVNPVAARAGR